MLPLTARNFPHYITVYPAGYTADVVGGSVRADGTGVAMMANVQSAGMDKIIVLPSDESNARQGQSSYDVSTQTDPGVLADQTIVWHTQDGTVLAVLFTRDKASIVFRGRLYRTRCDVRS